jgi:biotin-dependent carboxylase-like uncharacterized protein
VKLVIVRPGLLDLVQDLGRPGYRQLGVPEGGAADREALALANRLVVNAEGAAGLEFAVRGPELIFPEGGVVALTGGRFEIGISGQPAQWNETIALKPGARLDIGYAVEGCRGYLAVAGGLMVDPVMGSRSTFLPGGFGGLDGHRLKAGNELSMGRARPSSFGKARVSDFSGPVRVVAGPQLGLFSEKALLNFFSGHYVVDPGSDRTGIRLAGPGLEVIKPVSLASQGVLAGAVQVPPNGQPIILGWDGPVTGGYPVIGGVIAADLGRIAQLKPGDEVEFLALDPEEARQIWADRQCMLNECITWQD